MAWMLGCLLALIPGASAAAGNVQLVASIDGQVVGDGRVVVDPARVTEVTVTVSNGTADSVQTTTVRLAGTALGLTLFGYDSAVLVDVPPGATVTRSFPLQTDGLQRQVTGLLPVSVRLLRPDGTVLAESRGTGDVRGSVWSVYGVFWLAVVIVTAIAWAAVLVALSRQRLPVGPWRRAVRFLPAGIGTGVAAVITLAILRVVPPTLAVEAVLIPGCAVVAFVLGHLIPDPAPGAFPDLAPGAAPPAEGGRHGGPEEPVADHDTAAPATVAPVTPTPVGPVPVAPTPVAPAPIFPASVVAVPIAAVPAVPGTEEAVAVPAVAGMEDAAAEGRIVGEPAVESDETQDGTLRIRSDA